ncbi:MAG: hypothetical protein J7647_09110 [Cyanobacteria bacterium SBLK]|nr:hypothetical protein [Cyanobacteria bacterium SBLK]
MFNELFPFRIAIDTALIAGASLWSLALYLGLASLREWFEEMFDRWFNFAERSMYLSAEEFERTRPARESQNAFYASIFAIFPFLLLGFFCDYGLEIGLGRSWAISMGILGCFCCGVFELGRRNQT